MRDNAYQENPKTDDYVLFLYCEYGSVDISHMLNKGSIIKGEASTSVQYWLIEKHVLWFKFQTQSLFWKPHLSLHTAFLPRLCLTRNNDRNWKRRVLYPQSQELVFYSIRTHTPDSGRKRKPTLLEPARYYHLEDILMRDILVPWNWWLCRFCHLAS